MKKIVHRKELFMMNSNESIIIQILWRGKQFKLQYYAR